MNGVKMNNQFLFGFILGVAVGIPTGAIAQPDGSANVVAQSKLEGIKGKLQAVPKEQLDKLLEQKSPILRKRIDFYRHLTDIGARVGTDRDTDTNPGPPSED
jgi:hypothetical protein